MTKESQVTAELSVRPQGLRPFSSALTPPDLTVAPPVSNPPATPSQAPLIRQQIKKTTTKNAQNAAVITKTAKQKKNQNQRKAKRTMWHNDGPDPTVSSLSVLLDWITTQGNYARWRGDTGNGETKAKLAKMISELIAAKGIESVRLPKDVVTKVTWPSYYIAIERQQCLCCALYVPKNSASRHVKHLPQVLHARIRSKRADILQKHEQMSISRSLLLLPHNAAEHVGILYQLQ